MRLAREGFSGIGSTATPPLSSMLTVIVPVHGTSTLVASSVLGSPGFR
jgi:hypothetical protein